MYEIILLTLKYGGETASVDDSITIKSVPIIELGIVQGSETGYVRNFVFIVYVLQKKTGHLNPVLGFDQVQSFFQRQILSLDELLLRSHQQFKLLSDLGISSPASHFSIS